MVHNLAEANVVSLDTPTLVKHGIVLSARLRQDTHGSPVRFIKEIDMAIIPFTDAHFGTAVGAWLKYGKGQHPARLNFGDCLSYTIGSTVIPLLCMGEDLPQTDIPLA